MVYYVNCSGSTGLSEKEFSDLREALAYYEKCKASKEWTHVEVTKQIRAYLSDTNEEFGSN